MKPVVEYDPTKESRIRVGASALVWPLNHPSDLVSNTKYIQTSPVISHNKETGEFETQNTFYKPRRKE